jgi:hypothetical protein
VLGHLHAFLVQSGGNERRREDLCQ